jgi:hypothetical protein
MSYGRAPAFLLLVVATLLTAPATGQSVISTHSGTVHFFEGAVYVDDKPLESHPGRFSSVPQGGVLRTADGRAEVLLTPGAFVRLGERSSIRMVANALSNTRVELLTGSAMVDASEPNSGTSVSFLYKNWSVRFPERGVYRIDSDPPRLWVFRGEAEVSAGEKEQALLLKEGMNLPFAAVLLPERSSDPPRDALSSWAEGRQQSISADNAIAANIQDPAAMASADSNYGALTYFPMLGLSSSGPVSSTAYDPSVSYQPGFSSVYLPGYTYLPFLVGLYWNGYLAPLSSPLRPGIFPHPSRGPILYPRPGSPVSSGPVHLPTVTPHPTPVHPASRVGGAHLGAHR